MINDLKSLEELLKPYIKEKKGTLHLRENGFNGGFLTIKIPFQFYYDNFKNEKEKFESLLTMKFKYNAEINAYYYDIEAKTPDGENVSVKEIPSVINNFKEKDVISFFFEEEKNYMSPEMEMRLRKYCYEEKIDTYMAEKGYEDYEFFLKEEYDGNLDSLISELMEKISDEEIFETVRYMFEDGYYDDRIDAVVSSNEISFLTALGKDTIERIFEKTDNFIKEKGGNFIFSKDLFEGLLFYSSLSLYVGDIKSLSEFYSKEYLQDIVNRLKKHENFINLLNDYFKKDSIHFFNYHEKQFKTSIFQKYFFEALGDSFFSVHDGTEIRPFFNREFIKNMIDYGKAFMINTEGATEKIVTAALSHFINKYGIDFFYDKERWGIYNETDTLVRILQRSKNAPSSVFVKNELESRSEKITRIFQFFNLFPEMNFLTEERKIQLLGEVRAVAPYMKEEKPNEYESLYVSYKAFLYRNPETIPEALKNGLAEKEIFDNKSFFTELKKIFENKISASAVKALAYFADIEKETDKSILFYKFPETFKELKMFGEYNIIQKHLKIKERKKEIKKILNFKQNVSPRIKEFSDG